MTRKILSRNMGIATDLGNVSYAFSATASFRGFVGSIDVPLSGPEGGVNKEDNHATEFVSR